MDLAGEIKKNESGSESNCNCWARYSDQRINKGNCRFGNQWTSENIRNDNIIEIGQNALNTPGDLKRLAINQTPKRNHQLTMEWKTFKKSKIIIIICCLGFWYANLDHINGPICNPQKTLIYKLADFGDFPWTDPTLKKRIMLKLHGYLNLARGLKNYRKRIRNTGRIETVPTKKIG